jgi:hypothetical protein
MPLRHEGVAQGRSHPLHPGQCRASGQQGRALRQGLGRDHAALFAGALAQAAQARRRARRGEFVEIEWDEALALATQWLGDVRARNPDELAFFTGRDQSQALTGWWAQQFGTVNYAAHGGFCSVNMAAGGLYSIGGSFWEFGEPDWEHRAI